MKCSFCGNSGFSLMASRKNVPVLQNVLCNTEEKRMCFAVGNIRFFLYDIA